MAAVSSSRGMQFVFYVLVWKQDVYLWQICRVYVSHVQYRMCWHFVKVKLRTVKGQIVNVFFMLNNMLYCLFSMKIDYFMLFCTVLNASLVAPVSTKCQKKSRMPCVRYSACGGSYSENSVRSTWGEETRRCACCPLSSKEIWRFITL